MTPGDNAEKVQPRHRRIGWIVLLVVAAAILGSAVLLLGIGRWLVQQDPLEKAQAIVVLSGRMPLRAMEAARLYREGYAPKIWLTYSVEPGASLNSLGVNYVAENIYNVRVLTHEGVPENAIQLLQPSIVNTADEIVDISAEMTAQNDRTVIIVTSKVHTRRVRILWNKLGTSRGRAIIRAASDDPFEPGRWWRTSGDALDVVRECLGILNAWAGMPLRPSH
ncbi:MAG TPA: YdcF family protein [Candidatus Solibacter sp.]|nr:YdcF family protein [Candidatus Solibacter sp.]